MKNKILETIQNNKYFQHITSLDTEPVLIAGLYDANDVMLCTWEESGIDNECTDLSALSKYPTTTKIIIPGSVTNIKFFNRDSITDVIILNGATRLAADAFKYCGNLRNVTLPNSITHISDTAFCDTALVNINIPNTVKSIGYRAFESCNFTTIVIPDSVTSIANAFSWCSELQSVTLSNNLTSLGTYAFANCYKLASITWKGKTYTNNVEFNTAVKNAGIASDDVWVYV